MATPNYRMEKRQRDLKKKRKQEEKRQRKLAARKGAAGGAPEAPGDAPQASKPEDSAEGGSVP
ncbi:MAG: hypothetical protein M0015_08140 [Betaproteobacteria bacterium]|nr:hypothetical protein [Betaproteobacteria bacterium]